MRSLWILGLISVVYVLTIAPQESESVVPAVAAGAVVAGRVAAPAIKQAFHRYSTRKAAKEAAQRASKGRQPVVHGPHKPGYSPHYHQTGKNGKPTDYSIKRPAGSNRSYRVHDHFQFPRRQG